MNKYLKKLLVKASGNHYIQSVLERNILNSQAFMGIGSGSDVLSSGEQAIFDILKKNIKPPYTLFDIGANKGQFLHTLLDHITGEFSVHCFEPSLETFKLLIDSVEENTQVRLNNIGLGKERTDTTLYYDTVGSGLSSLTKRKLDHFGIDFNRSEKVKIDTIDNYCLKNGIDHIHLLKIDIEGHELDALSGAKKMFDKNAIDIVTFEFGGCNIDTKTFFQDFWYFFKDYDKKIFRITPSGYFHPIDSYKEIDEQFRTTNFIVLNEDLYI